MAVSLDRLCNAEAGLISEPVRLKNQHRYIQPGAALIAGLAGDTTDQHQAKTACTAWLAALPAGRITGRVKGRVTGRGAVPAGQPKPVFPPALMLFQPKAKTVISRPASRPVADNILPDLSGRQQDQPRLMRSECAGQLRQQSRPRPRQRGWLTGKNRTGWHRLSPPRR